MIANNGGYDMGQVNSYGSVYGKVTGALGQSVAPVTKWVEQGGVFGHLGGNGGPNCLGKAQGAVCDALGHATQPIQDYFTKGSVVGHM